MEQNRFQRLMREAHDALGLVEDEHRALGRQYEDAVAENKRLRFQIYGRQPMTFGELLQNRHDDMVEKAAPLVGPAFNGLCNESEEYLTHCVSRTCCHKHASISYRMTHMIVCGVCGDKRCPKADYCEEDCQEQLDRPLRTKIDSYFDVTTWHWVAEAVIPYRVSQ